METREDEVMPKPVKIWGSVGILSTIATSMILAIIGWFGQGTLYAYNNKVDVTYVKSQMDTMNQSLTEILVLQHEKNTQLEKHRLRIQFCEESIKECRRLRHD